MYIDSNVTFPDIIYIVKNLCNKAIDELKILFGESYKVDTLFFLTKISPEDIKLIKLKQNKKPTAIFGIVKENEKTAGVFFLSTDDLYKGNMISFLKETREQINKWGKTYEVLLDSCYKKNKSVIKWLNFLGFEATNEEDNNFQIYMKRYKNEY